MKYCLILLCSLLVGCSSLSGNNHYSCPYKNEGRCQSVSATYEDAVSNSSTDETRAEQTSAIPVEVTRDVPALTQPKVLRVLYAPTLTVDNDYDSGGYMYLKIEEAMWLD